MSKGKLLAVCLIWLVLISLVAVAYRTIVRPTQEQQQANQEDEAEKQKLNQTSSPSAYDFKLLLGLDSFSGYAIFRTPEFRQMLAAERIDLELIDDQANYPQRLTALQTGDLQMAAFPIDALIVTSAQLGKLPATIVGVIDETRGADAMVAYRTAIPNPEALDDPGVRFVLARSSPSEMLLRLMQSQFRWSQVSNDAIVSARDAADVLERYRRSKPDSKEVFITWEPYVSQILENDAMVRVVDSRRFKGFIVDSLVASRDFLLKNPQATEKILGAYFRVLYQYRDRMPALVTRDAAELGTNISEEQAKHLVEGIWWKNTLENFEHFGLAGNRLQLLEDMLKNVTQVLLRTDAIADSSMNWKPNELFFYKPMEVLQGNNFHPQINRETVRNDDLDVPELTDPQWNSLVTVGELQVEELVFPRGQAILTDHSLRVLEDLAQRLKAFPQYYLIIRGNASQLGNAQKNQELALQRAQSAAEHLVQAGIPKKRVKSLAGKPSGSMSVTFVLGQPAY